MSIKTWFGESSISNPGNIYQDELARVDRLIQTAEGNIARNYDPSTKDLYRRARDRLVREKSFYRPPSTEDLNYRHRLRTEIPKIIYENSAGTPLRFHGTPIYTAQAIIEQGVISSAVDHDGTQRSMDVAGQISVTTPETVGISINDYLSLTTKSLPIGCLFVIYPPEEQIKSSRVSGIMLNVNLRDDDPSSPRFRGVLGSPETLSTVQSWLSSTGFSSRLAVEYFNFNKLRLS